MGRTLALAPAFGFVSTIAYIEDEKMALNFSSSGTKNSSDLDIAAFRRLANKVGAPETVLTDAMEETRARFDEVWAKEKGALPLTCGAIGPIEKHKARLRVYRKRISPRE